MSHYNEEIWFLAGFLSCVIVDSCEAFYRQWKAIRNGAGAVIQLLFMKWVVFTLMTIADNTRTGGISKVNDMLVETGNQMDALMQDEIDRVREVKA